MSAIAASNGLRSMFSMIMIPAASARFLDCASNADQRLRMIDMDASSVHGAFEIKSCIERGEFVLILADRNPAGRAGRTAEARLAEAQAEVAAAQAALEAVETDLERSTVCAPIAAVT